MTASSVTRSSTTGQLSVLGVIPARRGSSRLPNKPLQLVAGVPLVVRVFQQAKRASSLSRVLVATDDPEIAEVAAQAGAEVVMTRPECENGSARVAEAWRLLSATLATSWVAVVNVQGDMPYISPELIDRTVNFFLAKRDSTAIDQSPQMVTVATPIIDEAQFLSNSVVKVVVGANDRALFFSRAPMPHSRDGKRQLWQGQNVFGYRHLGLYVFAPEALSFYETSHSSELEQVEMLEQLRLLEAGYRVAVCRVEPELCEGMIEVDTPEDLARASAMVGK